jgi:hypothetical protein
VDAAFRPAVRKRLLQASHALNRERLADHRAFLREREKPCRYENEHYGFGVVTKQERSLRLCDVASVEEMGDDRFTFSYTPHPAQQQQETFADGKPTPA